MIKTHVEYWKMAYLKASLLAFISFVAALQAGTANINWAQLGWFEQIMIILCSLAASATAVSGFLDKTMSRLNEGKDNPAGSDTTIITKQ